MNNHGVNPNIYRQPPNPSHFLSPQRDPIENDQFGVINSSRNDIHMPPFNDPRGAPQSRGLSIPNKSVREHSAIELLEGDPYFKFDGLNPKDFTGWYDQLRSKLTATGFDQCTRNIIHVLRFHLNRQPLELSCYIFSILLKK